MSSFCKRPPFSPSEPQECVWSQNPGGVELLREGGHLNNFGFSLGRVVIGQSEAGRRPGGQSTLRTLTAGGVDPELQF